MPTFQAEAEAPEALAANDTAEGLEDDDSIEAGDAEDDEGIAAEPDDAEDRPLHPE